MSDELEFRKIKSLDYKYEVNENGKDGILPRSLLFFNNLFANIIFANIFLFFVIFRVIRAK